MSRRSAAVPFLTLGATWIAFAQVLSFQGLALWVVGGSVVTYGIVEALARAGRVVLAMGAGVVVTGLVTGLARTLGGDSAGPITRSSLMACGVAAAVAVILHTRYPLALLAASLMLLGGALGLGAAERAVWVLAPWAVAAAATAAMLGPYSGPDLADRRHARPFAVLLLACGIVALVGAIAVSPLPRTVWVIDLDSPLSVPSTDEPSSSAVPSPTSQPTPTPTPTLEPSLQPTPTPTVEPTPETPVVEASNMIRVVVGAAAAVLALLLVVGLVLVVHRLLVWLTWRRLRRRLRKGLPADRVLGAWTWVRLRRARYDQPLPAFASPDVAASLPEARTDPALGEVARRAGSIAFNARARADESDATAAWAAAKVAGSPPSAAGVRQRWRWAARRPHYRAISRSPRHALPREPRPPARPMSRAGTG